KVKLLLFSEHKDTLDYLAGDGKAARPLGKLREWGLGVTVIHGGMKIGDRDSPGSRIYAEREFREDCQVMVATEAAGEGINLQFCWLMVNFDIPWNPVRLEQRMGRIHRYGQEKDCLILNFVSPATREGRVLQKLFERIKSIEEDLDPQRTGKVFNVLGDVFPARNLTSTFNPQRMPGTAVGRAGAAGFGGGRGGGPSATPPATPAGPPAAAPRPAPSTASSSRAAPSVAVATPTPAAAATPPPATTAAAARPASSSAPCPRS